MGVILIVATSLIISCVVLHGYSLSWVAERIFRARRFSFARVGYLILAAILVHLLEIGLFQVAYLVLLQFGSYGEIAGADGNPGNDLFYFSALTYTSLGYGDLIPKGHLRLLATVEALTGLIMIGWTTTFTFLVMQHFARWREESLDRQ